MHDDEHLILHADTWLCVLTGAGVSAESGIATFRDAGGLWEGHRAEDVASPEGFDADPELVWRFYGERRRQAATCRPNAGHVALADVERALGEQMLLVTQNVDGLHAAAGSERVVELHGNLWRTRCSRCDRPALEDRGAHEAGPPRCDRCAARGEDALLRPDIVWFGEALDPSHLARVSAFLDAGKRHDLVFLAVGTSGVVWPAAGLVGEARARGAATWLVNAEPPENARWFRRFLMGKSGEVLPRLFVHG